MAGVPLVPYQPGCRAGISPEHLHYCSPLPPAGHRKLKPPTRPGPQRSITHVTSASTVSGLQMNSYPTLIVTVFTCPAFPALSTEKNLILPERRRISGVWYTRLGVPRAAPPTV
jgi:hypothetical protein